MCVFQSLSHVWLFATPWSVACQAPLSLEFSRQEYWSGLPFPSPRYLPNPGIKPRSPTLEADFFTIWAIPLLNRSSMKAIICLSHVCVSVAQSSLTLCDPMDCSPPGSYVHGILQAEILEWVAIPFSKVSSWPRDGTCVSCVGSEFFSTEPPGKP